MILTSTNPSEHWILKFLRTNDPGQANPTPEKITNNEEGTRQTFVTDNN